MVKSTAPLQIRLTEPVIYLRGTSTGADFRGRPQQARDDGPSAVVRGLLTLRLSKPTRIRNISITLEGNARTEWPEGIGPKRTDTYEEHELINETTTFFSGAEEAKANTARRSASVGPGVLAQYDLDSDDEDALAVREEDDWETRGRPLPRSLSVLPADPSDWQEWYRDGISRAGSPVNSAAPSRTASVADLSSLINASGQLTIDERGPTPAYSATNTPPAATTPPISSHPSSILLHRGSRTRSPMPNGDGSRRASDQDDSSVAETPLAPPPEGLFAHATGSPVPNVRFNEGAAEAALAAAAKAEEEDNGLRRTASARSGVEEDSDYHPVRDTTLTAHNTPHHSPALLAHNASAPDQTSPHLERIASHNPPELTLPPATRRQSSLRTEVDSEPSELSRRSSRPRPGSIAIHDDSSSSLASPAVPDERGRERHHHRFSLAAALRGLSGHRSASRNQTGSRPGSRASSRTRGVDTPRTPNFEASEMSRNASLQNLPSLRSGARSRASSPTGRADRTESRGRTRHRLFGKQEPADEHAGHTWKEFRKGVYNYPISFTIPANAPPTVHAEFGSVIYRLKATVVRVGALTPNLVEEKEVLMIAGPQEDDMEETENVIVERQWEDQMRYQIALSGKAFPIGGSIPIAIRLMPLAKCKIFRLTIALEEKTDYFAANKKVARHETPRRFILFAAKNQDRKDRGDPLLPILSESSTAAKDSPLAPLARQAALNNPREFSQLVHPEDDVYASLLDPMGPWHLEKDLVVPDCASRIKFTTKHESTNMSVQHWLKVTIRVERGDDKAIDNKGRRKQFDIIIETPLKMLDCRVNTQYNSLPSYDRVDMEASPLGRGCAVHARAEQQKINTGNVLIGAGASVLSTLTHPAQLYHMSERSSPAGTPGHLTPHAHTVAHTGAHTPISPGAISPPLPGHGSHAPGQPEHDDSLLERNIVYDRLISGQEAETGEKPPTYKEAVAHAIRSARSASRAGSRSRPVSVTRAGGSRPASSAVSRRSSPTRMYIEE
ncbi:hypothetical protein CC85DRAFT_313564 [Cutaneotrichosporon oleaginosum]|uniref:Arrestin C-terminal-like domain-containing protein n=1 Tax=Cutaneotrichosporon oleaginosum TaxID=879819 RepID=A0A0J1AXE2_9TREE|nr:uncharacterized protein CC85DRAFT_313564 [Cutaneotrichosporon oleaginosum]KLT39979.1 hypothetical protein CC85DRAFT_313564 [Cutaneotrichosporon oleaginosum]TXT14168.1 hypothetical protein COLE_00361 [Cutaneotrichosporon oleaginosum]